MTVETPSDTELLAKAIDRLAAVAEQAVLALVVDRAPADPFPARLAELDELPPVRAPQHAPLAGECPIHRVAWKIVPAGISKRTGKPYESFAACPTQGCDQRPPR